MESKADPIVLGLGKREEEGGASPLESERN